MQKIIPFLWFDGQAEEAVNFYTSLFAGSKIGRVARFDEASAAASGQPKGSVMTIDFELAGQTFSALNGGPEFKFSQAVSFFVACESIAELDQLWEKLSAGGQVMMDLDKYSFSERYGWVADRFGVSWQLNLVKAPQKIAPALLFVGKQHGKAEEAMKLYTSLIENSEIGMIARYEPGEGGQVGAIKYATFSLGGYNFVAMENNLDHAFEFTQAISFLVNCETQAEVDKLWEKLSEGGEKQPCGWLRDKYGVAWQIIPTILGELLSDPDQEKASRVMQSMLTMTKINIDELKKAAEQK